MHRQVSQTHIGRATLRVLLAAFAALALAVPAAAQEPPPDEDIVIDLKVNYGVAFREGSWVPVDVYVNNTERDVSGFVEIRTRDYSGTIQSPVYRLPAESPKNSRKRFRLHCKLEGTDRLEAWLYHGNRQVSPIPAWVNLTPIDRSDYLGLILDDQHHDYGFLSSGDVIGRSDTRFHREGLETDQLSYLADHLPCYTTFDIIVMGNIDPERIDPAHRDLLLRYISLGGTLVVCLGQNANRYQGSWLEPLLGVEIGENQFLSEQALAQQAFPNPESAVQSSARREGMVTRITPANANVTPVGNDFLVGALNPVGAGHVATFTVDAVSGLLQTNPTYLHHWNRILGQGIVDRPLNLPAAIQNATEQLPSIAGVKLFPVSSVITYLLLYFFIAIVGNWLFWNWRKRREMAWVCLVVFSFIFTAYAMIFGTQGRARTTELEQLEILELSSGTPVANLYGITGLLAKGSGRFDATLIHPESLVADAARTQLLGVQQPGGMFGPQSENPFRFIQDNPGRVDNLSVGASEMRFLQTEAPLELDGALEADLTADDSGLRGTIQNGTGIALANPFLLYDGTSIRLEFNDGAAHIDLPQSPPSQRYAQNQHRPPRNALTAPQDMDPQDLNSFTEFLSNLPQVVLNHQGGAPPPCLVGWADRAPFGSIDMGSRAQMRLGATLVVAWLDVRRPDLPPEHPLHISLGAPGLDMYGNLANNLMPVEAPDTLEEWLKAPLYLDVNGQWQLDIAIPGWLRSTEDYTLEITVVTDNRYYDGYHGQCTPQQGQSSHSALELKFADADNTALSLGTPRVTETELADNWMLTTRVYTIDDWRALMPPRATAIRLAAAADGANAARAFRQNFGGPVRGNRMNYTGQEYGGTHYHAALTAKVIHRNPQAGV